MLVARSGNVDDAPVLAQLHSTTVGSAYRDIFPAESAPPSISDLMPLWQAALADPATSVFVARVDGVIVGSVVFEPDVSVPTGFLLSRLHVHPDYQQRGLGAALHDRVLEAAIAAGLAKLNLWVLEHNDRARRMYERRDWTLVPGATFANEPPHIIDVLYERVIATS